MTTSKSIHKSKIARRLVVYVLAFSTVVTLFLTALELYRDYRYDISLIDEKFSEIQLTSQRVIEENLWLLNSTSNKLLLEGILRNQNIVYLSIVDDIGELVATKGQLPNGDFRQKEIRLTYHYLGEDHFIGHLKIVATLDHVYSRLIETVFIILVTQGIKTFLVSIFILFLVWIFITRHLVSIKDYALKIQIENNQEDLTLERKDNYWTMGDEFHQLIDAINVMRKKLYNSYIEIEHQSLHDPLTGLPNRRLMDDRLKHELAQSERQQTFGAMLFIDLDHFKLLNDSLGHVIGDQILIETSKRIKSLIRKGDTVARIGGDEFIVILSSLSKKGSDASREAQIVGEKLQGLINKKMVINDHNYSITASIGITLFDGSNEHCEEVLKQADNAMYEAKAEGRNKLRVFHSLMQQDVDERLLLEQKLHDAIAQQEFSLNYQP
jgi:diguanylate cyclase (GGDEF)-like protein